MNIRAFTSMVNALCSFTPKSIKSRMLRTHKPVPCISECNHNYLNRLLLYFRAEPMVVKNLSEIKRPLVLPPLGSTRPRHIGASADEIMEYLPPNALPKLNPQTS